MTSTLTAPAVRDHAELYDAVTFYEAYRSLPRDYFTTNPAVDDNGTHLHLADPDGPRGRKFYGIAVPGADGVRITKTGTCPLCDNRPVPAHGYVVRYEQIGAAR